VSDQQERRPNGPGGDSPLSPEQLDTLAAGMARARKIQGAARLAAFTGWTLLAFGVLSFLLTFFSLTGLLVGCALGTVAWNELEGRKLALRFRPEGPRRLARNQLWFLGVIVLYCLWAIYKSWFHPLPETAQVEDLLELGPGFVATATSAFYGLVMVVGVAYQLGMYRYHKARVRMVEEYLAETPPWVIEVERWLRSGSEKSTP
jgi:hypothetical protein